MFVTDSVYVIEIHILLQWGGRDKYQITQTLKYIYILTMR